MNCSSNKPFEPLVIARKIGDEFIKLLIFMLKLLEGWNSSGSQSLILYD